MADPVHDPNPGELVASARAVVRRLCVRPHDPVTAEERKTLLALVGYAGHLETGLLALELFHAAWTEHQCGLATGDPEIAREKKRALMAAQKAVLETRKA